MTDDATPKPDETAAVPEHAPAAPGPEPEPETVAPLALPPAAAEAVAEAAAPAAEPEPQPEHAPEVSAEPEPQPESEAEPQPVMGLLDTSDAEPAADAEPPPAGEPDADREPEPTPAKKPRKAAKKAAAATGEEPEPEAAAGETGQDGPADAPAAAAPDAPESAAPAGEPAPAAPESKKKWYVVKVQSGREDSIKAAIERKIKIEGLEEFFGQIAIPVEQFTEVKKVKEKKNGETTTKEKKVLKERKKFQGYLFAEVEFNDRILYVFRETSGVGDFVGATGPMKPPPPMSDREVQAMLTGIVDPSLKGKGGKATKQVVKLDFEKGDKVKIRDGAFANMEGEVKSITEPKEAGDTPKVTVTVTIFGRPVEVELDYWHVDKA